MEFYALKTNIILLLNPSVLGCCNKKYEYRAIKKISETLIDR